MTPLEAETARLAVLFRAAGADPVAPSVLQPAGTLLDLYGEDIRARAYTTRDPARGELMLRPDFTVPVIEHHLATGRAAGRYTYSGPVFRMQEAPEPRPSEFPQAGIECFGTGAAAAARTEAEVIALIAGALDMPGLVLAMGDTGLLTAAVAGLSTSDRRKAALARHVWRPGRFRRLLDRYGRQAPPAAHAPLLARMESTPPEALIAAAGPTIGRRTTAEIAARAAWLRADCAATPIPAAERAALDALLGLAAPAPAAVAALRRLAAALPGLGPATDRLAARLDALAAAGLDPAEIRFEAAFGRTTLEYYDGVVFGAFRPGDTGPPVASGGRYDALCRALGAAPGTWGVGAVIRPAELLRLRGAVP
jgi:ATP phosphoribosyltransferase regulatory subunit